MASETLPPPAGARAQRLRRKQRARAVLIDGLGALGGLLLVVVGVVVLSKTSLVQNDYGARRYVAFGVGVVLLVVLVAAFSVTIARVVAVVSDYLAVSRGHDLEAPRSERA